MTFGCPISNQACRKYGMKLCDVLELRKMWLSDVPPKMSESRALSVAAMLVRQHYPRIKLLLTYCDESERAGSYKGAGWLLQDAHRYVGEVKINDRWLSVRNANRLGVTKQAEEKRFEHRRKWVLPLSEEMKKLCAGSADSGTSSNPGRKGRCNSDLGAIEPRKCQVVPEQVLA